jgi:hypothetical protein
LIIASQMNAFSRSNVTLTSAAMTPPLKGTSCIRF